MNVGGINRGDKNAVVIGLRLVIDGEATEVKPLHKATYVAAPPPA